MARSVNQKKADRVCLSCGVPPGLFRCCHFRSFCLFRFFGLLGFFRGWRCSGRCWHGSGGWGGGRCRGGRCSGVGCSESGKREQTCDDSGYQVFHFLSFSSEFGIWLIVRRFLRITASNEPLRQWLTRVKQIIKRNKLGFDADVRQLAIMHCHYFRRDPCPASLSPDFFLPPH